MISVIVPVYNVEKYISRCIESIIKQSYSDLEILLIDDGSTDCSGEICDQYAKEDNRIIVVHQNNKGVSGARNTGLSLASGDIISFVDADDYIANDMYMILLSDLERNDADIAMCNYQISETINKSTFEEKVILYDGVELISALYSDLYNVVAVVWNKIYRKKIFQNIRFPEGRIYEDEYIIHELYYSAKKISYNTSKLYYYLDREGSITNAKEINVLDRLGVLETRLEFCKRNRLEECYYLTLLRFLNDSVRMYFYCKKRRSVLMNQICENFENEYENFPDLVTYFHECNNISKKNYIKEVFVFIFHQWLKLRRRK